MADSEKPFRLWTWTLPTFTYAALAVYALWAIPNVPKFCAVIYPAPASCAPLETGTYATVGTITLTAIFAGIVVAGALLQPPRRDYLLKVLSGILGVTAVVFVLASAWTAAI